MKSIGRKVLVSSTSWFFAPDGCQYKAAFGRLRAIHTSQDTLGFVPSRTHTNWYLEVGNLTIAGCQVLQIIETEECDLGEVIDFTVERTYSVGEIGKEPFVAEKYRRSSHIYKAGE